NIDNDFWRGFVKAVEDALGEKYNVLLCNTEGNEEKEKKIFANLMLRNVDGVIVQPASTGTGHFLDMIRNSIPVVLLEETDVPELSFVKGNDYQAAFRTVKTCAAHGFRKIAFLSIPPNCIGGRERIRGFRQAAAEENCVSEIFYLQETSCAEVEKVFLPRVGDFSLVFCDDHLICMVLRVLLSHHIRIPDDLSLIAWSNKYFLSYMTPSISAIAIPMEEIGRQAADIILRNLNGEPHVAKTFVDEKLILRESFQPSADSPPSGVSGH
ncbi:MAG: substrate-binding domain-containing protein, partial [Lentisphaeria bacterium]|nr:substrate-binding domain-containing protein [Lentisphaeria bacterium]